MNEIAKIGEHNKDLELFVGALGDVPVESDSKTSAKEIARLLLVQPGAQASSCRAS